MSRNIWEWNLKRVIHVLSCFLFFFLIPWSGNSSRYHRKLESKYHFINLWKIWTLEILFFLGLPSLIFFFLSLKLQKGNGNLIQMQSNSCLNFGESFNTVTFWRDGFRVQSYTSIWSFSILISPSYLLFTHSMSILLLKTQTKFLPSPFMWCSNRK